MKKISIVLLVMSFFYAAQAQRKIGGEWSAGGRFGGSLGVTLKSHARTNDYAFELIAANSFDEKMKGFSTAILYEKLAPISGNGQLSAMLGGGFNFNFYQQKTNFGVSGTLGFDWRLKAVPLNFQADWMPTFFFINTTHFSGINGAFSVRYIFNRK